MSEHKWKTGDRAAYVFVRKLGDRTVYDLVGGARPCTIIGWDDSERCYLVRFDNTRWGLYGHGLGVATGEYLRPIPRTVEQITQEAVEDYEDTSALSSARTDCTRCDFLNALAAIIEAAIYADREERGR